MTAPNSAGTQAATYVSSNFMFVLDKNDNQGYIKSLDGGGVKADITTYQYGKDPDVWRGIARPKYEDITVQVGMSMSEKFYSWISDFFVRKITRHNGSILTGDFNFKEVSRRDFYEALISEVSFPALDGADKNPGYFTVKIAPEWIEYKSGDGSDISARAFSKTAQKLWKPSNFRMSLADFDCSRVTKVDGFAIKQTILEDKVHKTRETHKVPGRVEFPNLTVYVPEVDALKWLEEHDKALRKGKPNRGKQQGGLEGGITLYSPNYKDKYVTINLFGVGIAGATPDKQEATGDKIKQWKFELHVERMEFKYPG